MGASCFPKPHSRRVLMLSPPVRARTAAWKVGLAPELESACSAALAVVEHVAATVPGGLAGYQPRTPLPAVLADGKPWNSVTEEGGVKVRGRRAARPRMACARLSLCSRSPAAWSRAYAR